MSDKKGSFCISCGVSVNDNHIGIKCVQNHDICSRCCPAFVSTIFEEPHSSIPVRCPQCYQEIPSLLFERQLNNEQLDIYQLYIIQSKIAVDEKTQSCPHCKYFEIWMKSNSSNFFYCKNSACKKVTCSVCYRDVFFPNTDSHSDYNELESLMMKDLYLDDNEDQYEQSLMKSEGIFHHFACEELKVLKESIEKVIDKGEKRRCPKCKLAGRKDNACTHMTCPKCNTKWCYFCGKDENQLVDVKLGQSIYNHNVGWQHYLNACPMYFTEIYEFDERWPEDDDEDCLDRFHNILGKKLLRQKIQKLGIENFKRVLGQFPNIRNSLPALAELETEDVISPFIKKISRAQFEEMIRD